MCKRNLSHSERPPPTELGSGECIKAAISGSEGQPLTCQWLKTFPSNAGRIGLLFSVLAPALNMQVPSSKVRLDMTTSYAPTMQWTSAWLAGL